MADTPTLQDMALFAEAVWLTAGNDSQLAQTAVAHAILNQLLPQREALASGPASTVRAWERLPRIRHDLGEEGGGARCRPGFQDADYCRAFATVCLVVAGDFDDPTRGATRFHRHNALPDWARDKDPLALIGAWFFYRA